MSDILNQISACVVSGKINRSSAYPPSLKNEDGVDELTMEALQQGYSALEILEQALMLGMYKVGKKFRENKMFVPQVLMSAKAMRAAMEHLKPFFCNANAESKGVFIIGTVEGDLHDVGKNLVATIVEGNGYEVIDLGTDVNAEMFIKAAEKYPGSIIGLSALLTTTMQNMQEIVQAIKDKNAEVKICVGGAPVNQEFCNEIGADSYNSDPQGMVEYLNSLAS